MPPATYQDYKNVQRKLTMADFHYFYNRFFATQHVNYQQASRFLQVTIAWIGRRRVIDTVLGCLTGWLVG
jgi:hypothetical protein